MAGAAPAVEALPTRVVSSGDVGDLYDFNVTLGFVRDARRASLKRESLGSAGQVETVRDLQSLQVRNTAALRIDVGVLPDVGLFVSLPFVVEDTRRLEFDQEGEVCPASDCVDQTTSSFLRDRTLPVDEQGYGVDVPRDGRRFVPPAATVFEGPKRSGLEYLGVGINWAVFNQERVPVYPTWLLSFESRFSVAKDMRYDPANPSGNTGVGPGYHQLVFSTMSWKRFGRTQPFVGGSYMVPVKTSSSPFEAQGPADDVFSDPQQRLGAVAGLSTVMWQDPRAGQQINFELRGRAELLMRGLARGDMWEPLTGAAGCPDSPTATCRPGFDVGVDYDADGTADTHPGITRSPAYGIFGADAGLSVTAGKYVWFRGLFGVSTEQARFMTDGRSGNQLMDRPGRRYYVDGVLSLRLMLEGALLF